MRKSSKTPNKRRSDVFYDEMKSLSLIDLLELLLNDSKILGNPSQFDLSFDAPSRKGQEDGHHQYHDHQGGCFSEVVIERDHDERPYAVEVHNGHEMIGQRVLLLLHLLT